MPSRNIINFYMLFNLSVTIILSLPILFDGFGVIVSELQFNILIIDFISIFDIISANVETI